MLFWWHNLLAALSRKKYYYDDDEDAIQQVAKSHRSPDGKTVASSMGPINGSEKVPKRNAANEFEPTNGEIYLQGQASSDCSSTPSSENFNIDGTASNPGGDQQKLARVLGLVDLTMLGVGATLGVGVYVLAGSVARNEAGPSVVISFAIAAVASLFSGFCYSEFASRISKSGSAYNYTYLSIGEFAAYIIGWNLVLEYIIGTACEAKAIANQVDSLLGNAYRDTMTRLLPIRSTFLASYPDFIAPVFVFLITGLLSWGARESAKVNNLLTFVNLGTVGVIVFSGMFRLNPANWTIPKSDIPAGVRGGSGGFAPFGLTGIVTGAAKCFFGFVGFDGIATTGEETHNPKRNIPLAIILSLLIVFVCYFSIALVITMIIPYYEQNAEAPFPAIFDRLGWPLMKWAVTIGSLVALFTAMFGAFFPLPRILFAMSRDGLLYKPFSYVSPLTQTPLISTAISGFLTAVMSAVFKLDQLVDMMSIGTLLAYIIVAVCVLLLRYSDDELEDDAQQGLVSPQSELYIETLANSYKRNEENGLFPPRVNCPSKFKRFVAALFNTQNHKKVTQESQSVSKVCIHFLVILTIGISFLLNNATRESEAVDVIPTPSTQYEFANASQFNSFQRLNDKIHLLMHNKSLPANLNPVHLVRNSQIHLELNLSNHSESLSTKTRTEMSWYIQGDQLPLKENPLNNGNQSGRNDKRPSEAASFGDINQSRDLTYKFKYVLYIATGCAYLVTFTILARQGQNKSRLNFKVPFVPLVPCVSIFMNIYLMINLDVSTWVRFLVWLVVGMAVYFSYSISHSKQKTK